MRSKTILLLLTLGFFSVSAFAQDEALKIVKSEIPKFPPTARAIGAIGEVQVTAQVVESGDVISAQVFSGHPLLRTAVGEAASKWKFGKSEKQDDIRSIIIAFYFGIGGEVVAIKKSEKESEEVSVINAVSSSRVEMRFNTLIPKLLLLPRVNGQIKKEKCAAHNERMEVEILPVLTIDGLDTWSPEQGVPEDWKSADEEKREETEAQLFREAQEKHFPNARTMYFNARLHKLTERAEVHYCNTCRINLDKWQSGNHAF